MVRNLSNVTDQTEEKIFENLENDIAKHPSDVKRCKRFGIYISPNINILKKNVFMYFCQLANKKQLSTKTLNWMADFAQGSPYEDIRKNYHSQEWVSQYRNQTGG